MKYKSPQAFGFTSFTKCYITSYFGPNNGFPINLRVVEMMKELTYQEMCQCLLTLEKVLIKHFDEWGYGGSQRTRLATGQNFSIHFSLCWLPVWVLARCRPLQSLDAKNNGISPSISQSFSIMQTSTYLWQPWTYTYWIYGVQVRTSKGKL